MNNKIYIGNLPYQTTEVDLENAFKEFGAIKETALIKDKFTGECKGFAFVTYESDSSAQASLAMDGKDLLGRPVRVNIARPKEGGSGGGRSGGGGRYGSGGGRSSGGRSGGGGRSGSGGGRGRW